MPKLLKLPVLLLVALVLLPVSQVRGQTAEAYYESALEYEANDQINAAIIQLKNALQQSRQHLPSRIMLGRLLLTTTRPLQAEKYLQQALDMGADSNLVMPSLGLAWLQSENTEAIFEYKAFDQLRTPERARWQEIRGRAFLILEDYEAAIAEFDQSLQLLPNQAEPIAGKAYAMLFLRQISQANTLAQRALELSPGDTHTLKLLGDIAVADERADEALAYYGQAIDANPNNYSARMRRVVLDLARGNLERAQADIDEVLEFLPGNPHALVASAMLLLQENRNRDAQRLLEEISYRLSNIPRSEMAKNVNIQIVRALTYYLQGDYDRALPILRDINQRYPEKTFVRQMLTDTYVSRGLNNEIVDLYRPIKTLSRSDARYIYAYARAAGLAGRERDAARKLREWAKENPQIFGEVTHLLAANYATQGLRDDALSAIASTSDEDQAMLSSRLLLGSIQLEMNNLQGAAQTAESMVESFPEDTQALNFACIVSKRRGAFEQAELFCEKAIAAAPQNPAPVINLAAIYLEQERYPDAIAAYNAILTIFPRETRALEGLAYIAEQEGEIDIALQFNERLAALLPRSVRHQHKLAELYLITGDVENAVQAINNAEALEPLNTRTVALRAEALKRKGDIAGAGSQLRFLYGEAASKDSEQLLLIAREQLALRRLDDARVTIEKLSEMPGQASQARLLQARYYYLSGEASSCIEALSGNLGTTRENERQRLLVQCLVANGQPGDALEILEAMLKEDPSETLAVQRFRLHVIMDRDAAIEQLERYIRSYPDSPAAIKIAGDFYVFEDLVRARRAYTQLVKEWPEFAPAEVNNNLANILILQGDPAGASEYARRAYELAPDNASVADTYGWVLVQNDRFEEGLKYLREAWARSAASDEVNYHLAYTLDKLGRRNEAQRYAQSIARPERLSAQERGLLNNLAN